ncbi:RNA polymerase sigma factor [Hyphococcus flavus]|uniref:RNA polymerase sigma factor n=1 Tax=Hyphococcus flavus TaxID=1866326 RepID=A0AAE9ZCS7_9PROT|nr:RNA polymerase sigma factor [Hyphococcus flavus]WDI32131.1 RNA polymerase sigma factor [Hyphococcus flavus]
MERKADSDEALVKRAGSGDRAAAALLVERHTKMIYAACYRMMGTPHAAEDATQETFLRLWRSAAKWKPRGAKFETWLYRVAMNYCLDQLRKAKRDAPEEAAPERADGADRQDQKLFLSERRFAIDAALSELPERQKMAITLCHYQELSNIEAAEIMEISVDALESLLARGRRSLRDKLAPMREHLMGKMDDEQSQHVN